MEAVNHPPADWVYLSVIGPMVTAGCNGSEEEVKVWWMSWWSPCSSGAHVPTHLQLTFTWAQIYNWCVHTKHIRTPFLTWSGNDYQTDVERTFGRRRSLFYCDLLLRPPSSGLFLLSVYSPATWRCFDGVLQILVQTNMLFIQSDGIETWRASAETSSCNSCRIN